jgi:cardiolipin synthase
MEYFIIEHGEMWDTIVEILAEKAKAGVTVRIIYDDMGCFLRLPHKYAKILRKYGIDVVKFNPFVPFFSAEQNNRDHRKITVIDGKIAFTGGINLADEYIGSVERFGDWADTGVMLKGRAAWSFAVMFLQMWRVAHKKEREDVRKYLPKEYESAPAYDADAPTVLPYADNPMDEDSVGALVYAQIIQNARHYVYITTPYLIIDDNLLTALTLAARSGVDVRIITPHIWDKRMVHVITRSYYYALVESGVKIFEYTPGFMHAKMVVADDEIATVGSINFDYRSLYLHFECGALFYRDPTVEAVKARFLSYEEKSEAIVPKKPRENIFARLRRAFWRLIAPLL